MIKIKKNIEKWLDKYGIKNYKLIPNDKYGFVIDVYQNFDLKNQNLKDISIKFKNIFGDFFDNNYNLTPLSWAPSKVNCFNVSEIFLHLKIISKTFSFFIINNFFFKPSVIPVT